MRFNMSCCLQEALAQPGGTYPAPTPKPPACRGFFHTSPAPPGQSPIRDQHSVPDALALVAGLPSSQPKGCSVGTSGSAHCFLWKTEPLKNLPRGLLSDYGLCITQPTNDRRLVNLKFSSYRSTAAPLRRHQAGRRTLFFVVAPS